MANEKTSAKTDAVKKTRTKKPRTIYVMVKGQIEDLKVLDSKNTDLILDCANEGYRPFKTVL